MDVGLLERVGRLSGAGPRGSSSSTAPSASAFDLPVRLDIRVTAVSRDGDRYLLDTAAGTVSAAQVVVATGPFQTPVIPSVAAGLDPAVVQLHSSDYRNPEVLPRGGAWWAVVPAAPCRP